LSPHKNPPYLWPKLCSQASVLVNKGIRPDLAKLTAVIDWGIPQDLLNGTRSQMLDRVFQSLTGLRNHSPATHGSMPRLDVPRHKGKAPTGRQCANMSLVGKWTLVERRFLNLKLPLTSEPVIRSPRYDGTPFVVTSDGCMTGFAGVLSQWHETILANAPWYAAYTQFFRLRNETSPARNFTRPSYLRVCGPQIRPR